MGDQSSGERPYADGAGAPVEPAPVEWMVDRVDSHATLIRGRRRGLHSRPWGNWVAAHRATASARLTFLAFQSVLKIPPPGASAVTSVLTGRGT